MNPPQIRDATPVLLVRDAVKAAAYYPKLGFAVERFWGEPPRFTIAKRDGVSIMLNQVAPGDEFPANGDDDGRFSVYLDIPDADVPNAEFVNRGPDIVCEPEDHPYTMCELQVRDLDGHLLGFGHDISEKN
jgi:hypothetical protein